MGLSEYQRKRKFEKTREPKGKVGAEKKEKRVFVVQKHQASHLHWDFRFEDKGVLKSWAVPKEPSKETGKKRLAIQTEDHPLEYAKFKGKIPEGQYGAGKVEIWDKGKYELLEKTKDKFTLDLKGKKLKGKYFLTKFKTAGKKSWLLFKGKE
jgi:DNA ligase D-like protein (predicted 3'-phosphoesterase)